MNYCVFQAACISRIGLIRDKNEDNFIFANQRLEVENVGLKRALYAEGSTKDRHIFAVFDGMGGFESGEVAAFTAADFLLNEQMNNKNTAVQPSYFLRQTTLGMNQAVHHLSSKEKSGRFGTTTAMLYMYLDQVYICNIGDSRIYRMADGVMTQLSDDDVIYNPELKNQHLTQYIGVDPVKYKIEPHIKKGTVSSDDIFMLCTDGLYNAVPDNEIMKAILHYNRSLPECAEMLADLAEKNGGEDNCTVILMRFFKYNQKNTVW